MAKLRLNMNSNLVEGRAGLVDISLNGTELANNVSLSANVGSYEYDVTLVSGENLLGISLTNNIAHNDEYLNANISGMSYSVDGVTYTQIVPFPQQTLTIPSGPFAGNILITNPGIDYLYVPGDNYEIRFNETGLSPQSTPPSDKIFANWPYMTWDGSNVKNSAGDIVTKDIYPMVH